MKLSNDITLTEDGMKIGTCEHCGASDVALYPESNRCEDCDDRFYLCSVCKEEQFDEDTCRHIFRGPDCKWKGSGAWIDPNLRKPLFRLFDLMPAGFSVDLRAAIKSGLFHTWACLPMIGSGGSLTLHGMPKRDGLWVEMWWGEFLMEIGMGDQAEETADGYHWLASLYEKKTLKANRITIKWIDEYLTIRLANKQRNAQECSAQP